MPKDKQDKKKLPRHTDSANDDSAIIKEMKELLDAFSGRLDDFEDRLGEMGRDDGGHKVILAKQFYQSDNRGILEVTRISKLSSGPFSLGLALGDYLGSDIQSGKMTLPRRRMDYFFRLQLSTGGWNRAMSIPVLQEQVAAEGREEEGIEGELEAGRR